ADARRALTDVDQAIFVAIDEGTQKHSPDNAEDRRVRTDAERERDDDCCSKALGSAEGAPREPDVLDERPGGVEPAIAPHASNRVARERDVAEFSQSREPGRPWILATIDALLHAECQM